MAPSVEVYNAAMQQHPFHDDPLMLGPQDPDFSSNHNAEEEDVLEVMGNPVNTGNTGGSNEEGITKPGEHDVLLGRGGGTNNHSGNVKFRKLVNEHKLRYLACSKVDKPKVARDVVQIWRKLTPPGRFLARRDDSKRGPGSVKASDNVWYEVGDKKAREKASQCLRERTPDVMPYIKQLREQQDAITEQGVSMVQQQLQMQQEAQRQGQLNGQHDVYMDFSGRGHMAPRAFPGRRTSMPVPPDPSLMGQAMPPYSPHRRGSLQNMQHVNSPHVNSPHVKSPHMNSPSFNMSGRRASGPAGMQAAAMNAMAQGGANEFFSPPLEDDFYGNGRDMNEMEYQQNMMMMQQQVQMQQLQMQRMQQERMQRRMQQQSAAAPDNRFSQQFVHNNHESDPFPVQSDPLMDMPAAGIQQDSSPPENEPSKDSKSHKRSREAPAERSAPDRAPTSSSLMSFNVLPGEGDEITIEEYRKQLEEYIESIENNNNGGNDEYASDLEDDWEKEREKNLLQQQDNKRGVNRNVSGCSFMSAKTTKSNLSLFSGISASMFSDNLSTGLRESKMSAARSVCSNLSLMSELTDLSENLDTLGLDD